MPSAFPLRRLFTFRLRTLFLLVALLCALLAWRVYQLNVRQCAYDAIVGRGEVEFTLANDLAHAGPVLAFDGAAQQARRRLAALVRGGPSVLRINFYAGPDFREIDGPLALLPALAELREVSFSEHESKHLVRTVAQLHHLESLALYRVSVTDDDLATLGTLTRLRYLWIGSHRITADGLAHLRHLPHLEMLDLLDTGLGDEAIDQLRHFPKLKGVSVPAGVSADGLRRLLDALPGCIYVVQGPLPR